MCPFFHDRSRCSITHNCSQFIVSEVPCNLALKHYGSWFLGVMTFCFGIATLGSAFVTTKGELIATRVFLGLAEGGAVVSLPLLSCTLLGLILCYSQD